MVEKFFQILTVITVLGIAAKLAYLHVRAQNKKNHHSSKPSHTA